MKREEVRFEKIMGSFSTYLVSASLPYLELLRGCGLEPNEPNTNFGRHI